MVLELPHSELLTFSLYFFSVVILSIGLVDFGVCIYQRYSAKAEDERGSIGYAAHIGGGLAGLLVGMNVLRNFHHKVQGPRCKTVLLRNYFQKFQILPKMK